MSFRFRVGKVWQLGEGGETLHVIGWLEAGKIIPPVMAHVAESPGASLLIDGIVIGGGKPLTSNREEFTLSVSQLPEQIGQLEGCLLIGN